MTAHQSCPALRPGSPHDTHLGERSERSTDVFVLVSRPRRPHERRRKGSGPHVDRAPLGRHRRVRVLNGPLEGRTFCTRDGLAFGRDTSASVRLVGDAISWRHARVRRLPNGRDQLEDLDSTNGTMVEGLRIRRQQLAPGMVFTIGETYLVYEDQAADMHDAPLDGRVHAVERRCTARQPWSGPWWSDASAGRRRHPDAPRPRRTRPTNIVTTSLDAVEQHPANPA